jgi:hypothetical protein
MSAPAIKRKQRNALLVGLVALVCVALARVPGVAISLAYLGPGIFVLLLLRLGGYPGERAILAWARSRSRSREPGRANHTRTPSTGSAARMPRGGALLAAALAGRAPPPTARQPRSRFAPPVGSSSR